MRVSESVGVVSLLVERAQGVIGDISVEWSTEDATAVSTGVTSPDYQVCIILLTKSGSQYPTLYHGVPLHRQLVKNMFIYSHMQCYQATCYQGGFI